MSSILTTSLTGERCDDRTPENPRHIHGPHRIHGRHHIHGPHHTHGHSHTLDVRYWHDILHLGHNRSRGGQTSCHRYQT